MTDCTETFKEELADGVKTTSEDEYIASGRNNEKLQMILSMINSMEDAFAVSVIARGGSYGSSRLIVRDNVTGEEVERG